MAKLNGLPPFIGTRDNICIYRMHGIFYARSASSLTGKRVKKDPRFKKTMQYAALLKKASRIGSVVYQALPVHKRKHALYRRITGEAMQWLKYAWKEEDIIAYLLKLYNSLKTVKPVKAVSLNCSYKRKTPLLRNKRRIRKFLKETFANNIPLIRTDFYQKRLRKQRRKINQETETYAWATMLLSA